MLRALSTVAFAALAAGFGASVSTAPAGDNDKGFVQLFNGKDMTGWKFFPEALEKKITVTDGMIVVPGNPPGYFYTDKSYKNYVVRYDWQYKRPAGLEDETKFLGNSGLLVHIQAHKVWPKSLEIQGMNRDHGSFIGIGIKVTDYKFDRAALEEGTQQGRRVEHHRGGHQGWPGHQQRQRHADRQWQDRSSGGPVRLPIRRRGDSFQEHPGQGAGLISGV